MVALIISQNQASHSCNKSRLFYLVQTPVKVYLWSMHLHCLTLSNLGKKNNLRVCFSCVLKNQGLLGASLLSSLLPLDGTKAHGKIVGSKVGLGRKRIISGCWASAPMAGHLQRPSSTPGHRGASWKSLQGRTIQVVSVSDSPGLNLRWISVELFHEASLGSRQWDFWPVKKLPVFLIVLCVKDLVCTSQVSLIHAEVKHRSSLVLKHGYRLDF